MTIQESINWYNKAHNLGKLITEENIRLHEEATQAVNDILSVATLCENLGGELKSRQLIAAIIHMSKSKL